MTNGITRTADNDPDYRDAALETQSRMDWDGLKLGLLQRHVQHAYRGSPYYQASIDAAGVHPVRFEIRFEAWTTFAASCSSPSTFSASVSLPCRPSGTW